MILARLPVPLDRSPLVPVSAFLPKEDTKELSLVFPADLCLKGLQISTNQRVTRDLGVH